MNDPDGTDSPTPRALLALLEQAQTPREAGRLGQRLLDTLMDEPPMRRLSLSELPPHGLEVLQALARSDLCARSGELEMALAMAGLPEKREALERFCGVSPPRADERLVPLSGRPVPLWKVIDAVAHDGVPLAQATEALREVPGAELEAAFRVLLHEDAHGLLHRVTPIDEDPDQHQDQQDFRAVVRTLAALVPAGLDKELLASAVRTDDNGPWTTVRAALVSLRARGKAPDAVLARAASAALRPLLSDVVRALSPERAERVVLAAVPEPMSAYAHLDEVQLEWLRLVPTKAVEAERDRLPEAFLRHLR